MAVGLWNRIRGQRCLRCTDCEKESRLRQLKYIFAPMKMCFRDSKDGLLGVRWAEGENDSRRYYYIRRDTIAFQGSSCEEVEKNFNGCKVSK